LRHRSPGPALDPGIPPDAGLSILLDISSQNSYAVFCFIKRGLGSAGRP
jgi:hypothetical protein